MLDSTGGRETALSAAAARGDSCLESVSRRATTDADGAPSLAPSLMVFGATWSVPSPPSVAEKSWPPEATGIGAAESSSAESGVEGRVATGRRGLTCAFAPPEALMDSVRVLRSWPLVTPGRSRAILSPWCLRLDGCAVEADLPQADRCSSAAAGEGLERCASLVLHPVRPGCSCSLPERTVSRRRLGFLFGLPRPRHALAEAFKQTAQWVIVLGLLRHCRLHNPRRERELWTGKTRRGLILIFSRGRD